MKPHLPLALALTGLIAAGLMSSAQLATAQQSPPAAESPREHFKPSAADRAAFREARIAALHAGLALTPDQEKLWPPVETALRDLGKLFTAQLEKWRQLREQRNNETDPVTKLKNRSESLIARGEALKKLADAAAPLYASLTDEQKHRLPILLAAIRPHHRHHWLEKERFGNDGPRHEFRHDFGREEDER